MVLVQWKKPLNCSGWLVGIWLAELIQQCLIHATQVAGTGQSLRKLAREESVDAVQAVFVVRQSASCFITFPPLSLPSFSVGLRPYPQSNSAVSLVV